MKKDFNFQNEMQEAFVEFVRKFFALVIKQGLTVSILVLGICALVFVNEKQKKEAELDRIAIKKEFYEQITILRQEVKECNSQRIDLLSRLIKSETKLTLIENKIYFKQKKLKK